MQNIYGPISFQCLHIEPYQRHWTHRGVHQGSETQSPNFEQLLRLRELLDVFVPSNPHRQTIDILVQPPRGESCTGSQTGCDTDASQAQTALGIRTISPLETTSRQRPRSTT